MSHGPAGGDTVEPNLTPMLDLVLQLLMLFMICGNYASESNDPVELAKSQTAKQLTDSDSLQADQNKEDDFLFITVKPYESADGVRKIALNEINNREILGTNPNEAERKKGYTAELAGRYRKMVDNGGDPDSIYNRLRNHDLLSNEQAALLKDLNVPINSEDDLAKHIDTDTRGAVMAKFKDGDSYVIVPGADAMRPDGELQKWLHDQYKILADKHNNDVKTAVVIRPDGNMDYAVVYRILLMCQDEKFTNLKVRALIRKGTQS